MERSGHAGASYEDALTNEFAAIVFSDPITNALELHV